MSQSMLFLKCERDAYAARFVKMKRQREDFECEILDSAFDYLRTPRQNLDVDMVREMYAARRRVPVEMEVNSDAARRRVPRRNGGQF